MSKTYIFAVHRNGDVVQHEAVSNAFQGAAHIWMTMIKEHDILGEMFGNMQPVWDAPGTLGETDDWVLMATFDHAIVRREEMPTYLTHLRDFTARHPTDGLKRQIEVIDAMQSNPDIIGVAWNQTSVNGDEYCNWLILRDGVDENDVIREDDTRPYNIFTDTDHFFVTSDEIAQQAKEVREKISHG